MAEKSNLVLHAEHELPLLRAFDPTKLAGIADADVIAAVQAFADEGHSGASAAFATAAMPDGVVRALCRFEPLTPLTGAADEWFVHDHDEELYAQNKRCGHVFKRRNGVAYDIDAVAFRDPDGTCWTNGDSRRDVTFPYVPKTEIVDRPLAAE